MDRPALFGRTSFLVGQLDEFLDKLAEGGMLFERGLRMLIDAEPHDAACREKAGQLQALKERANELRRSVVNTLYSEMLIPDFRGDVLRLLSKLYRLLDVMGHSYLEFLIEHVGIRQASSQDGDASLDAVRVRREFADLIDVVVKCVLAAVAAARAFFRGAVAVQDHINEIRVHEAEADGIALRLKERIFSSQLSLDRKRHIRDAVDVIDAIADMAEDLSDDLAVVAIKRAL